MIGRAACLVLAAALVPAPPPVQARQAAPAAQPLADPPPSAADLKSAIDRLGTLDYRTRSAAARLVRRTPPAQAVPALLQVVEQHGDGYVRFRALVLLSSFNSPRIPEVMRQAAYDPNDRLREVAYLYFEDHPDTGFAGPLLDALERETSEFVRPRLIRALAALGDLPNVRQALLREVNRGQDFFRSAVIEALGDHKAAYAADALSKIAQLEGPLQDDAALALGKVGDKRYLPVLAGLQRTAPREAQPAIAAGICLLGVNCEAHRGFLARTLTFAEDTFGFQELLRSASAGLAALASTGDRDAAAALLDVGIPAQDPARAPLALATATMAVKNPVLLMETLEPRADRAAALTLVAEGFDMLEEDFAEERFFAAVRRRHWTAPEGSPARQLAADIITRLEF